MSLFFPQIPSFIPFSDVVGCTDPEACLRACGSPAGCSNVAYPRLVVTLLPTDHKCHITHH
ncbi:Sodium/glucose cotransporter 2 [Aix galericulata]|nr:Sodium/glucose cotransporter 2 [Aix galericulata]